MSHMRKLLLESLIHKAAQARVQPFPQLSVVSLTPQLSVINCQSDTQVHVTLTSMPSPLSFRNKHSGTYTQTQTHTQDWEGRLARTLTSWTDISLTSVILKGQPVRSDKGLSTHTSYLLVPFFLCFVTHHRFSAFQPRVFSCTSS